MGKRGVQDIVDGNQAYLKRQKITNTPSTKVEVTSTISEIGSGKQLRQILAFDQDAGRSKHSIQSFKAFLDAFSSTEASVGNGPQVQILKDYLESQKPSDDNDRSLVFLVDIMQMWSYAAQSNNDSLLSAVPAVLALLLRTISGFLELVEYGYKLGRTLLQKSQLDLMARGLRSNKTREFLISPVLRLLREISIFDGGSLAKHVFRAREQLFQALPRNLNLRFTGQEVEDRKRPSVRTNAVRFVLALLKFLPTETKKDLLNQRDVVSALTRDIKDDPPFLVHNVLDVLKTSVLKDEALTREAKTKIINAMLLSRIALLYRYNQPDEEAPATAQSVEVATHDFLLEACTSPFIGVLNRQTGFYPRGVEPDDTHTNVTSKSFIDLGYDSIEWQDRFKDKVPVRNTILGEFAQNLRPWSSTKQSNLLLAIFTVAPELVAEYFYERRNFSFEPKLTATWIGYSAFIFSAIKLPIPTYFGHSEGYARLPPPTTIVLENILPQPLTQKVLRACLLQDQKLISFFAVRLLCCAFEKLQNVQKMYQEASSDSSSVWAQAARRLTHDFCDRCPLMKDVIFAFRKTTDSDLLQREALTKLLVLYFETTPQVALETKYDVSESLGKALQTLNSTQLSLEDRTMRLNELENLFRFAHFSPGMRWFGKMQGLVVSPFTAMLKLSVEALHNTSSAKVRAVLSSIAIEHQIMQSETAVSSLDTLIVGLRQLQGTKHYDASYSFLDDCVSRCASKPIKYIFMLEELESEVNKSISGRPIISLLTLALAEQWPFLVKSTSGEELNAVAKFISHYLARLIKIGEDKEIINAILHKLISASPESSPARTSLDQTLSLVDTIDIPEKVVFMSSIDKITTDSTPSKEEIAQICQKMLPDDETKSDDHNSLTKWTAKEVDEAVEEGQIASLILLLASEHLSVRKEALVNISKFAAKLKDSTFEEKDQIWLLLSEVGETAKDIVNQEPLATVIAAFAAHAINVLTDPLHCLYPKINKFLSQGPTWELTKIPLMYKVLDEAPSLDDAHYSEMNWLLTYMLAGLRTTADMTIYRRRRVFEKLFSVYNSPYLGAGLREKILRIFFQATTIEGGSTTLITRFSTMTWLQAQIALSGGISLKVLLEKVLDSSDQKRVRRWSKHGEMVAKSAISL